MCIEKRWALSETDRQSNPVEATTHLKSNSQTNAILIRANRRILMMIKMIKINMYKSERLGDVEPTMLQVKRDGCEGV